jgi:uncharacterized protein (DUF1499 family)
MTDRAQNRLARTLATFALALALSAALLVVLAGPGHRFGWWHFRRSFELMQWGAYAGIAAALLGSVAAVLARRGRALTMGAVALLVGLAAFFVPWNWRRGARAFPPIHDVTTDFQNPPELAFSRAMRDSVEGMNTWAYGGDSIAAQQRKAYPDIAPVLLAMPLDSAYGVAYRTVQQMGWEVTAASRPERRIEAAATTAWFGFVDDVVVRVTPGSGIARVDVRSVSRVGRGDVGANAKRIREFTARLKKNAGSAVAEAG